MCYLGLGASGCCVLSGALRQWMLCAIWGAAPVDAACLFVTAFELQVSSGFVEMVCAFYSIVLSIVTSV